jgi:hypothetical protein
MKERAYTHIDRGLARVANRWMERQWSTLQGATVALVDRVSGMDWLELSSPEIHFELDGSPVDTMALGPVDWSEESDAYGATLVATRVGQGLRVVTRTLAFHASPGMMRSVCVTNLTRRPRRLTRFMVEGLAVVRDGVRVLTHGFAREHDAIEGPADEPAVALVKGPRGLLLGREGCGALQMFSHDPEVCAVVMAEERVLAPVETWELPDTFVAPCPGREDASRVLGDYLSARARMIAERERLETERAGD